MEKPAIIPLEEKSKIRGNFWGKFACFARWLFRTFSHRYEADVQRTGEPVVYVCRHLNMHGPFTTMKWMPFDVHPMTIHVFFERKTTVEHMTHYTLSARFGRKERRFSLLAHIMSWINPTLMRSLQAVPVYREGVQTIRTFRCGLNYLLQGESLIVYPDMDYTGNYDEPSEIYEGFLYIGELYYKKTGKLLQFVPLAIDDQHRKIIQGKPVTLCNYRKEGAEAAEKLKQAINSCEV